MTKRCNIKPKTQLRIIREENKYSRNDVAVKTQISIRTIEKIESGEQEIKLNEAKKLAILYKIGLEEVSEASKLIIKSENVLK